MVARPPGEHRERPPFPCVEDLTPAEQATLTVGVDFWHTAPVPCVRRVLADQALREHPDLLKHDWDFDRTAISGWFGTHSATSVAAGLDLQMRGPARVLHVIERATAEAIVTHHKANVLPLRATSLRHIAEVAPGYVVSPLEAIRKRAGTAVHAADELGCTLPARTPVLDHRRLRDPGMHTDVFSSRQPDAAPATSEVLSPSIVRGRGSPAPRPSSSGRVRATHSLSSSQSIRVAT